MNPPRLVAVLLGLMLSGPLVFGAPAIPLLDTLGSHTHPVTTTSPEAQRYFDQGLRFLFGFNHGAAIRSFQEAARLDPECAMAHWGIAFASGPHINFPMVPPPAAELAWAELQLARQHAAKAAPVERALIEALGHRYANPQPEDRGPLDRAYADAMREVWKKSPHVADVGAFFAEALMDLRPWDQWTREDLALLPGNGWSLFGLAEALLQQGKPKEVTALRRQFKEVWRNADLTITSSCLCQPGG